MPVPAVELEVGNRTVRVTSPDKLYFPEVGLTKLDMVQYVVAVGDGIFAALQDRPVTMERWPGGYRPDVKLSTRGDRHGDAFYQKRAPTKGMPDWVETVHHHLPVGPDRRRGVRDRAGHRGLDGQPRHAALPPVAGDPGRHRAGRPAADRPRPAAGHRLRATPHAPRTSCEAVLDDAGPGRVTPRPAAAAACTSSCRSSRRTGSSRPGTR